MKQTTHKLLSLFLAMCMILSLLPASALATGDVPAEEVTESVPMTPLTPAEPAPPEEPEEEVPAEVPVTPKAASTVYVKANGAGNGSTVDAPVGTLKAAYDAVTTGGTICVLSDLTGQAGFSVANKTVTVKGVDSDGTTATSHTVTFSTAVDSGNGIFKLNAGANMTFESIKLKSGLATPRMFEMDGNAALTLGDGGEITGMTGNSGFWGQAVHLMSNATGSFTMESGSAITGITDAHGIVWTQGASSTFSMEGGEISGNTIADNGAVLVSAGNVVLSGAPIINNNTKGDKPANVYLGAGKTISVSGMTDGANVGVFTATVPSDGTDVKFATTAGASGSDAKYFHSDNATTAGVIFKGNALWLSTAAKATAGVTDEGKPYMAYPCFEPDKYYALTDGTTTTDWVLGSNIQNNTLTFATAPASTALTLKVSDSSAGSNPSIVAAAKFLYVANANTEDGYYIAGASGNPGTKLLPLDTIANAYAKIAAGETGVIIVLDNLSMTAKTTMSTANTVTITGETQTGEKWPALEVTSTLATQNMFIVTAGTINFQNLTLDGKGIPYNPTPTGSLAILDIPDSSAATVTMGKGVKATNFDLNATVQTYILGVQNPASKIILDGATFTGNTVRGSMADKTSPYCAGLFSAGSGATLEMRSGEVSGNTMTEDGAIVSLGLSGSPSFKMSGGSIRNNKIGTGAAIKLATAKSANAVAKLYFEGTPYIYNNTNAQGAQRNIHYANDGTVTRPLQVTGPLTAGAVLGVYAATMPTAGGKTKLIAVPSGDYDAITKTDMGYFASDKATEAGFSLVEKDEKDSLYLDYDKRLVLDAHASMTANGQAVVVNPAAPNAYYTVVNSDGTVITLEGFAVTDGKGTDVTKNANGWYSTDTGSLTFAPVPDGCKVVMSAIPTAAVASGASKVVKFYYVKQDAPVNGANGSFANPYPTLPAAYTVAKEVPVAAILLLSDLTVDATDETVTVDGTATVTLTSASADEAGKPATKAWTINYKLGAAHPYTDVDADGSPYNLFRVMNGKLVLEKVTVDGSGQPRNVAVQHAAFYVAAKGTLVMNGGATLQNCYRAAGNAGTPVFVFNGDKSDTACAKGGTFIMNGGKITGNTTAKYSHGAVFVDWGASFTMNGGEISGNHSDNSLSGVVLNTADTYPDVKFYYRNGKIPDGVELCGLSKITLADGWKNSWLNSLETGTAMPVTKSVGYVAKNSGTVVDGSAVNATETELTTLMGKLSANNGDAQIKISGKTIIIDGTGNISINLKPGTVTNARQEGTSVSYRLGNAVIRGTNAYTFSISVDNGYFKVKDKITITKDDGTTEEVSTTPAGLTFYAGLTTRGVLKTTGTGFEGGPDPAAAYVDLIFTSENKGVSSAQLQQYLREYVTFYRPGDQDQSITVQAENYDKVNKPADGRTVEAFRGHYYEFVADKTKSWSQAYAAAKSKTFNGLTGYLITVTGSAEHNYVYQKFGNNGWMGASRALSANGFDQNTYNLSDTITWNWRWDCGPEAGKLIGTQPYKGKGTTSAMYTNWSPGEPNGRGVAGTYAEGFGQYGWRTGGRWNDLANRTGTGNIQGYYVEYGGYENETLATPRASDTRLVTPFTAGELPTLVVGAVTGTTTTVTVSPTQDGWQYAILDKNGDLVPFEDPLNPNGQWQLDPKEPTVETPDVTTITFTPLKPGTEYTVIAVPEGTDVDEMDKLLGRTDIGTVVTPVIPALKPGDIDRVHTGDGTDSITIAGEKTKTDRDYAVVDKTTGEIIGWETGTAAEGSDLAFTGLDPDHTYEVVEAKKPSSNDVAHMYAPGVVVPPLVDKDTIKDGGFDKDKGTSSIVINPTDPNLDYAIVGPNAPAGWTPGKAPTENEDGSITFDGLTPGGNYEVVTKPKKDTVTKPDEATGGITVKVPNAPVAGADRGESTPGADTDKITIPGTSTDTSHDYALTDNNGNFIEQDGSLSDTPVWITGTGTASPDNDLVWNGLDPDETYHILSRPTDDETAIPSDKPVYPQATPEYKPNIDDKDELTGKLDMTVGPLNKGDYEITVGGDTLPQDGIIVKNEAGNILTPDANNKYPVTEGGGLVIEGVKPGESVTVSKDNEGDTLDGATVPALTPDQIAGGYDDTAATDKEATITIKPAVEDVTYAVVDKDGNIIDMGKDTDKDGSLTFDGLKPDEDYTVVVIPDGTTDKDKGELGVGDDIDLALKPDGTTNAADSIKNSGVDITAPVAPVNPDSVTREPDNNNVGTDASEDKIVIGGTTSDKDYSIVDKETGEVIATKPGAGIAPDGDSLTFNDLDPDKEYEIVVTPKPDPAKPNVNPIPAPGTPVKPQGQMEVSGVVTDQANKPVEGATVKVTVAITNDAGDVIGSKTLTAKTDKDGKYTLSGLNVKPGTYQVYVDGGDKGNKTQPLPIKPTQPQTGANIKVDGTKAPITGGAVTDVAGKPVKNQAVTIIDKKTGEPVSPTPTGNSVLTTTPGGGYVVEGLGDGTYIIQTSGNGNSGMTEVTVKDGVVTPNKEGGYNSTGISTNPGGILTGKVNGLADGEKATVSIQVPVYGTDGTTVIGSKTVTAQAVGEGGHWQIAGVPAGTYPVTVTTPKGTVSGTVTVSGNDATAATTNGTAPTNGKLEASGNKLVVTMPGSAGDGLNSDSGVVLDQAGKPVVGADVTIYDKDGNEVDTKPKPIKTGTGGGWTVSGLDPADGPYTASINQGDKNTIAGPFNQDSSGKVTGPTNATLDSSADDGDMLHGTVKDESGNGLSGATVVVKDSSGKVIGTTTTDSNGDYFVGGVPDGATVTVTTPDGKSDSATVPSGTSGVKEQEDLIAKKSDKDLVIVGPNGESVPVGTGTATDTTAKVTITGPTPGTDNANGRFTIADGKVTVTPATPDGTYVVTVEQGGMTVKREITVSGGAITGNNVITVGKGDVTGDIKYENGALPSDATITIKGTNPDTTWGQADIKADGSYKVPNVPEGTYTATVTVKDKEKPDKNVTITTTVTVDKDGNVSYGGWTVTAAPDDGVTVDKDGTIVTVGPSSALGNAIQAAQDALSEGDNADLAEVSDALGALNGLTSEQKKQLDKDKLDELANALTDLFTKLTLKGAATGTKDNTKVEGQLQQQAGLTVTKTELEKAKAEHHAVDVTLTMKAEDTTDSPDSVAANQVAAEATKTTATVSAYYDITVTKNTVVKKNDTEVSNTSKALTNLPTPVTVQVDVPDGEQSYQYYSVIRVHNGEAVRIPSTPVKSGGKVVAMEFSSNLYSTFAILGSNDPIYPADAPVQPDTPSNPGSSSSTIKVDKTPGGSVTTNPKNPKPGDKVTITVKPDAGNMVDKVIVTNSKGKELEVTDNGDGTYTYTQPKDAPAKVRVEFVEISSDPAKNGVADWLITDDHIAYMQGNEKGEFMPAANMTRAEAAQMLYNLLKNKDSNLGSKASFSDVDANAWYATAVNTLANIGILNGVGGGNFAPQRTITRAEFVSMLTRFAVKAGGAQTFSDVEAGYWANDAINTAAQYGWVKGYGDGTFKPLNLIARSEAAAAVNRMLGRSADVAYVNANPGSLKQFPDVASDYWAFDEIAEATNAHDFEHKNGVETWKIK